MITVKKTLENFEIKYPLEKIAPLNEVIFVDIETTGFAARSSNLYLIGVVALEDGQWTATQFFAENYSDEAEVISEFFDYASPYKCLIHFNGNQFDIPYISQKCASLGLEYTFDAFEGLDIYKRVAPYKNFLKLENCKQKTIERFLKIEREDKYSGGDLIGVYHSYVKNKSEELKSLLLLHNFDDICGMPDILPVLAVSDIFNNVLTVTKVSANYYKNSAGNENAELLMTVNLPTELIVPVSYLYDQCYFTGSNTEATIRVPMYEGELKYFYAGYKDYYYLPDEDIALHKSVASFVDKNHREPAKANNCYTRKIGKFLPEWDALVNPFFKKEYGSRELFFELTEERRTDRDLFSAYASHVLSHMISM